MTTKQTLIHQKEKKLVSGQCVKTVLPNNSLLETHCGDLTTLELLQILNEAGVCKTQGSVTHLCSRQSWKYLKDKHRNNIGLVFFRSVT